MALSAALVFEVRASGASDNNGGGFKAGAAGTDRSQQNAAQVVIDNSTITTSITANVITFTGYVPTSADVGNLVQMLTGTNVTAGFYEITAQTATTWTVTGAVALPTSGTTTNATGNMGGALATLAKLAGAMVASNKAYCTGSFTTNATITFAQASGFPTAAAPLTRLVGYGSSRGDTGRATITLTTNTGLTAINCTNAGFVVEQFIVDCATLGTSSGITVTTSSEVRNCKVSNFTTKGIQVGTSCTARDNEVTGGTAAATAGAITTNNSTSTSVISNWIHDNATPGVVVAGACVVFWNIIANNSGASSDGVAYTGVINIRNNTIHNNGRDGIRNGTNTANWFNIRNNILTNNGGYGLNLNPSTALPALPEYDGNAYGGGASANTSGARNNADSTAGIYGVAPYTNVLDVILTASPYVGPTSGGSENFALNTTAGGGAACKGTAQPGTFPGLATTTGYPDMGAVQHQDSSVLLKVHPGMGGGMRG